MQGLTDDMVKENRRKDYEYALKMTGKGDLDAIERIMTEKLTQRSKAGIYLVTPCLVSIM